MNLSISNIGWSKEEDIIIYDIMKKYNFSGIEIAPTRIFPENPYENLSNAKDWIKFIRDNYGFVISSMQSIWYGKTEKLFGSEEERKILLNYTKKAIDFAQVIGCKNIVFGCPKNRNRPKDIPDDIAVSFFKQIGEYALQHNTVVALEANPYIYGTNYINDTMSAFRLAENISSKGFLVNLDIGTMICNDENASLIYGKVDLINHVHISEPKLALILKRNIHKEIIEILKNEKYDKFISIEMAKQDNLNDIEKTISYVREIIS